LKVAFRESFTADLRKTTDRSLLTRIRRTIEAVESAESLSAIPSLKRLVGSERAYRIRIGDYRLGLVIEGDEATFVRFLHRREIYRHFP
jgi:mRNA interferase RelE/StbE